MRQSHARRAFSLIELLITMGIIAILFAILMPVVTRVRAASRTTVCLTNLQQWGAAYHMYLSVNRGQMPPPPNGNDPHHLEWWQFLSSNDGKVTLALLCPEATATGIKATPADNVINGSAHGAWEVLRQLWGRTYCSYGLNAWTFSKSPGLRPQYGASKLPRADEVPLLGDCIAPRTGPHSGDGIPPSFEQPAPDGGLLGVGDFCIDRHRMAVNIVFIDGHAETIPLAALWKLRWSSDFKPRDVTLP